MSAKFRTIFNGKYVPWRRFPHGGLLGLFRRLYNARVIRAAQRAGLTCAGCALDRQQIDSVVACEDAQLVLASAGSGKTLSLLAKIEYIHRELGIAPEQILAISFTKKTVVELVERCAVKNVDIRTFHGLGNSIVNSAATSELGARELIDDAVIADFIQRQLATFCASDPAFYRRYNDYILFYYSTPASPGEFANFAARVSFNRLYLRHALKNSAAKTHDSRAKTPVLAGDFIRSKEEQLVANWLYIHGLDYKFQQQYPHVEAKYRPTFTLGDVYIDLLQIARDGSSPNGREYLRDVKWRRAVHAKNRTKYIELYAYQ